MNPSRTPWMPVNPWLIILSLLCAGPLCSAEPPGLPEPPRFRRIYVPADELSSQAQGMIPLKREEFERRIVAWTARQPNSIAPQVRVEQATYSARLEGDQLVDGNARLEVRNATTEPALLTWESTLPLGKPLWDEQPPRPARLGTAPTAAAVLLVEKSGRLIVPWSLRRKAEDVEDTTFDLQLPEAAISRLVLQLPVGLTPETDAGIVTRLEPSAEENRFLPISAARPGVNWLVELGGLTHLRLWVKNPAKATQKSGVVLVRESATHILSPVDVSSEFGLQLDIHQIALGTLKLELDAKSRVIDVRLGGAALSWRDATPSNPEQTVLQVDLPNALTGSGNVLTVSAVSPLALDSWRLPRLRLAGSTWQEGTATLVVPPALQVGSIQLTDSRQTSISPGSRTQPEQTLQFQYLSPLGQVLVQSARDSHRLKVLGGLVVRHEATQLSAVLNLDMSIDTGERFAVEGLISEEWIVDSVDTSPPDLLEEQQFVPLDGRKFTLRLRLARPLTPKDKTRLVIRAHRQLPAEGEVITAPALRLVEFQDVREEQLVVALRATDSSREFQLSGDLDLFRIDPESAAPEELSLLDSSAAGILFRLDRQGEGSRVSLVPSDPRFTAAIESSALAQRGKIEHHASARIVPTSSSLTRLMVRSSGPVPAAMRWKLVGAGDLSITSQTLLPALSPPPPEGQRESVWELVFSRITTQPLTLEAAWETSFSPGEVLPLFSFPGASAQEGLVRIEAGQGVPLLVETEGVKPVPAKSAEAGAFSPVRGLFRYEPGRQATVSLRTPPKDHSLPAAWANRCTLQSRYSLDGAATHEITWQLENHGLDRFPFSVPDGTRPLQITVDGEGGAMPAIDINTRQYSVPLPDQRRYPVITLTVSTRAPETTGVFAHHWTAPLVTTPLQVLDRNWHVTLPPGIQRVAGGAAEGTGSQRWNEIWRSRLWGVLTSPSPGENVEFESPWSETEPLVVTVYSPGVVRIWGLALAVAAASLVVWLVSHRLIFVLMVAALFACAALLVPEAWSPLAAGIVWGTAAGGLFSLVRPHAVSRPIARRQSSPSTRTQFVTGVAGSLVLLAMSSGYDKTAAAAPDETNDKVTVARLHRVIIPVDADQKPQGDYVYVSLDFYTLLYRAPEREQLPAWMLRSASYNFEANEEGAAATVVMRLELETLAAPAKISLPLRRGEVHLLEGRATLEGEPISLNWDDAGTSLRLEIERAGQYQLTLAFSAAAKMENGAAHWNISIQKTPRASLRIKTSPRPGDWLLPEAQGAIAKAPDGGDLLAELGPTATLNISRHDPSRPADDMMEAEQLVWWKVRPGSVTADLLFRLRPITGKISEIKLLADPHLRLLPLENEPRVARIWVEEGALSTIHLMLAEPVAETVELRGKFLLLEASGVGKLVLPRLEVVADQKLKQWQAISIGKDSEITLDPQIPVVMHPPVEFVDSFGGAARPPNLAFEAADKSPAFLIRPQEAVVHAKETIDVSLGRQAVEIRYRADLTGIPPHRFQEVIDLPAGFRVRQAVLLEQEASISLRPPAVQQGSLTIHRAQSPATVQQLLIEGTLLLDSLPGRSDLVRLPGLRSAANDGATIRIYRTPAVLALIKTASGMQTSATPEGAPWDSRLGHLLASYKSAPSPQAVAREFSVDLKPNNPATTYRLVTQMERTNPRSWSAVVNCDVTIESGLLDAVRCEVPAEWSGPFEFTPPMDHQVVLLPGQTQRHLVIRPTAGSPGTLSFSIRGPLKLQTGETPHAPVLLPLDAVRVDSFLRLPSRVADENLQWQTSGLQAMAAGESNEAKLAAPGHEVFRVVAPRFSATLLQSNDSSKRARILLANLEVRPMLAGSYWAKANYYLLPGGRSEAELKLPPDSQLVQVLVNDSPAQIRSQPEGTWRIRLGHEQLPQQVVVIYERPAKEAAKESPQALPPVWLGISTEKTSWSFLSFPSGERPIPDYTDAAVQDADPRRAALSQMAAVIRMVRDAGDTGVAGLPPRQLADWLSLWRLEFSRVSRGAQLSVPAADNDAQPEPPDRLESERLALEAEFSATMSRYSDILMALPTWSPTGDLRDDDRPQTHLAQAGAPAPVPFPIRITTSSPGFPHRLGLAMLLLSLTLVAAYALSTTRLREFLATTPAFAALLLAPPCLMLLPAGQIAAVLVAATAAWFSLRHAWPAARTDDNPHTVRPSTISRPPSPNL